MRDIEKEKEICLLYTSGSKIKNICEKYKLYYHQLYTILKRGGINRRGNLDKIGADVEKRLIDLAVGEITGKELSELLHISLSSVSMLLKKNNIRLTPQRFEKKYELNDDYFEKIDSQEKAQVLGLIYADGSLSKHNYAISIRLWQPDEEYLEKIRNSIGSNKPFFYLPSRIMISPLNGREYQAQPTCILDITSKTFYQYALGWGLVPNKTKMNIGIPINLDEKFYKGFILGLFEGDGCITSGGGSRYFSIACQEKMATDLQSIFRNHLGIEGYILPKKHIYTFTVYKKAEIVKIYDWLYENATFWMSRKREKFLKICEECL